MKSIFHSNCQKNPRNMHIKICGNSFLDWLKLLTVTSRDKHDEVCLMKMKNTK